MGRRGLEGRAGDYPVTRRILAALLLALAFGMPSATAAERPSTPRINDGGVGAGAERRTPSESAPPPASKESSAAAAAATKDPYEYQLKLDCTAALQEEDSAGGARNDCSYAMQGCQFNDPPSDQPLMVLSRRVRDSGDTWQVLRRVCGPDEVPPGTEVPAIPTLAQIEQAFRSLPFGKPSVSVQPVGGVTLVNLPTFYAVSWPDDATLVPGEVSDPVQLLSWSVEFRVASRDYEFDFGDGASSGRTTDPGGVYPDGGVRHTYVRAAKSADVRVDAWLSGEYRVNGGGWQQIDAVADLQDEPVTALEVRTATNRLEAAPR